MRVFGIILVLAGFFGIFGTLALADATQWYTGKQIIAPSIVTYSMLFDFVMILIGAHLWIKDGKYE